MQKQFNKESKDQVSYQQIGAMIGGGLYAAVEVGPKFDSLNFMAIQNSGGPFKWFLSGAKVKYPPGFWLAAALGVACAAGLGALAGYILDTLQDDNSDNINNTLKLNKAT